MGASCWATLAYDGRLEADNHLVTANDLGDEILVKLSNPDLIIVIATIQTKAAVVE